MAFRVPGLNDVAINAIPTVLFHRETLHGKRIQKQLFTDQISEVEKGN